MTPVHLVYVFEPCEASSPSGELCRPCADGRGWGLCRNQPRPPLVAYIAARDDDEAVREIGVLHPGKDVGSGRALTPEELRANPAAVEAAIAIHVERERAFDLL